MKLILILSFFVFFSLCCIAIFSELFSTKTAYSCLSKPVNDIKLLEILLPAKHEKITQLATIAKQNFEKVITKIISNQKKPLNFANTFGPLDEALGKFNATCSIMSTLEIVSPNVKVRNVCRNQKILLHNAQLDLLYSKQLFNILNEYSQMLTSKKVDQDLSEEKKYYVAKFIEEMKLDGLALPEDKFEQFKQIKKQLIELSTEFEKNINQVKTKLVFSGQELDGVSQAFLKTCKKTGEERYSVGLDAPSYTEIIENCKNAETRAKIYEAYISRAWPENEKILEQILQQRATLAQLLNLESFAAYDTKLMMVKNPQTVKLFLDELMKFAAPKMAEELTLLKEDLPSGVMLDSYGRFKLADLTFTREQFRRTKFDLDENVLKEYFPLDTTINGVFQVYQDLLGLDFFIRSDVMLWHDDVKVIQVYDRKRGNIQGFVILDLHPRDNKYSHACMSPIVSTINRAETFFPAVCTVIANLPRKCNGEKSLLKLNDVRTFFHEFGHAMHQLLGTTETNFFSGTQVLWDFVETPSQMFEEWLWEPSVLKKISGHYLTGEAIPEELIKKIIASRGYDVGYWIARQVNFARYSLECHSKADGKVNLQNLWTQTFAQTIPGVDNSMSLKAHASWGHLTGYSAKYYTYLWSLVFACDLFDTAQTLGLESKEAASRIQKLLKSGGSIRPEVLLENFLQRKPTLDAMAKRKGLIT